MLIHCEETSNLNMSFDEAEADTFETLKTELEKYMLLELNEATQFTSKDTVVLRIFKRLSESLRIPWSSLLESTKNAYYFDARLQNLVWTCWTHRGPSVSVTAADDQALIERIVSRDYARPCDLVKMAAVLTKKCSQTLINKIFAVDGFAGKDLKRYVEFLKYSEDDYRGKHVRLVRKMYDTLVTPDVVHDVVKLALVKFKNGSLNDLVREEHYDVVYGAPYDRVVSTDFGSTQLYTTLKDSIQLEALKFYVEDLQCNDLDNIADWKLKQLDELETVGKKPTPSKRKKPSNPETPISVRKNRVEGKAKRIKKDEKMMEAKNEEEIEYLSSSSSSSSSSESGD